MHHKHRRKSDQKERQENSSQRSQKRRNFFPVFALLVAAGTTVGLSSLVLNLADVIGGAPRPITTVADSVSDAKPEAATSELPMSESPASESSIAESPILESQNTRTIFEGSDTLSASVETSATLPLVTVLGKHSDSVLSITTPTFTNNDNGTPIHSLILTGGQDNTVRIWSAEAGSDTHSTQPLVHSSYVNDLVLVPTLLEPDLSQTRAPRVRFVSGSGSGEIKLWELVLSVDGSTDSASIDDASVDSAPAEASAEGAVTGFEYSQLVTTIADNAGRILSLAANADGSTIASGSSNGTLKTWPVEEIAIQKSQTNLRGRVLNVTGPDLTALQFHPNDPNILISGNQLGTLHVWDTARMQITLTLTTSSLSEVDLGQNNPVTSLSVSPDGRYIAGASSSGLISIWDIETGKLTQTLFEHRSAVTDVAFSADGQVLVSSSLDQTIKAWDWVEGNVNCTLSDRSGPIRSIAFTSRGDTLISGSDDGTVKAWDLNAGNHTCVGI